MKVNKYNNICLRFDANNSPNDWYIYSECRILLSGPNANGNTPKNNSPIEKNIGPDENRKIQKRKLVGSRLDHYDV